MNDWISREETAKRLEALAEKRKGSFSGEAFEFAAKVVRGVPTAVQWIPVSERLPEKHVLVLCIGKRGGMFLGSSPTLFSDGTAYFVVPNARCCRYATYWMPLPEPPKGE